MNSARLAGNPLPAVEVDALRHLMVTATQRLLGDTIVTTDEQWRGASRLPGWTRGHVATHLARQADALVRLVQGARAGEVVPMYASATSRGDDIEAGAGRSGLDLQIDLDTSAGALSEAFEAVAQEGSWETTITMRGDLVAPLRALPLARLSEVVLHHVDLEIGMEIDDIDEPTANCLLEWLAFGVSTREEFPRVRVTSDSGLSLVVGSHGEPRDVRGGSAQLLGWLSGRSQATGLQGAADIVLPAF